MKSQQKPSRLASSKSYNHSCSENTFSSVIHEKPLFLELLEAVNYLMYGDVVYSIYL